MALRVTPRRRRIERAPGDPLETQKVPLGGDVERMRANLDSRRMLGELRCGDGKVEQKIDAKARLRFEEVRSPAHRCKAEAEGAQLLDDFADRLEMIRWLGHHHPGR